MITHSVKLVSAIIALGVSTFAAAGTLEGVLTFEKRNPYVGVAFFSDATDGGPEICGALDQKDKAFSDMLVVGKTGCEIGFTNSDDTDHNIFANDLESGVSFDVGLIEPGGSAATTVSWSEGHLVRLGCKIHPKMVSYIANLPTRHFSVIEFVNGQSETHFAIGNVPDDASEVTVILQPLDPIVVEIQPGESKEVEVTRSGKAFGTLVLTR